MNQLLPNPHLVDFARMMVQGLGLDPHEQGQNGREFADWYGFRFTHDPQCQLLIEWGGLTQNIWECKGIISSGDQPATTGRTFRMGGLVWIHDRLDRDHPITDRGALFDLSECNLQRINSRVFVINDAWGTCLTTTGVERGAKLWCLEPIASRDFWKSAEQMQAERAEIKHRCMEAESAGGTTLRQVIKWLDDIRIAIELCGATSELLQDEQRLRQELAAAICKDAGVTDIGEAPKWTVLSSASREIYARYRELTNPAQCAASR